MFERFAEEARRATALASAEARELDHDFIGTEHLLLGLLASGEGMAFSVLTDLEVTLDDARRKVTERVHGYGSVNVESPPFTPLAKKSLERALREALQLKAELIGSEHLLLGLVAVPDGGGARILEELAGSLDRVRQAVLARVGKPAGPDAPLEQTKAPVTSKTLRRWATQSLLVLRPPTNLPGGPPATVPGSSPAGGPASTAGDETGPLGAPPRCPACRASLLSEARFCRLAVPSQPGPADKQGEAEGGGGGGEVDQPGLDEVAEGADDVLVTFVYCGQCGVALGVV